MGGENRNRVPDQWRLEDSQEKFRELVLWLCAVSETDPTFGATKLNKLLFFIDLEALRRLGRTITDQEYQKLPQGPAPRTILSVLRELEKVGEVITREQQVFRYAQKRTFALREPNLGMFTADELSIMKEICLKRFWRKTAKNVSDLSHEFMAWQLAQEGDTLPLMAMFISNKPLQGRDKELAAKFAKDAAETPEYQRAYGR